MAQAQQEVQFAEVTPVLPVTCGNVEQRAMIFYRYLCDAVANKIPVVILYKGNGIDSVLNSINGLVNVHPGSLIYDPFYGKTILEIWLLLDSILSNVSTGIEENANKRLAFERYARIISPNDSRDITLDMFKWVLELDEFGLNYYIDSLSYMNIAQKSQTKKLFEPYFSARQNGVAAMKISCQYFQFSSVTQLCPTLCDPMNCSTPGLPVHH